MKRWNGWGREEYNYHFAPSAQAFVEKIVGKGIRIKDAELASVIKRVPKSRLPEHALFNNDAELRIRHSRGRAFRIGWHCDMAPSIIFPMQLPCLPQKRH
jgi:alkyldihydroxyacetonephosphate synthase